MEDAIIKCPKCGAAVPITEALAGPLLEAANTEHERQIKSLYAEHLKAEKKAAEEAAVKAMAMARAEVEADFAFEQNITVLAQQEALALRAKLTAAQLAQAEALRKERELADRERELDLTIERRIANEVVAIRAAAQSTAEDEWKLKLIEKDTLLESMQTKITELKQKAEQGSQQLQGEAQELSLEAGLRAKFRFDEVTEVAKGVNGADVVHRVVSDYGSACGVILYESKRTKNWSAGWLGKLREDGRKAKADLLVIVSQAMPVDVESFDSIDNVWVVQPRLALALATALRETLIRAHASSVAREGMATKAEEVYSYVTGPQFKHRIEALMETFTTLQEDLAYEQKSISRQWAKRATQIERILTSTAGMFGDLQGLAGRALPSPEGMALLGDGE